VGVLYLYRLFGCALYVYIVVRDVCIYEGAVRDEQAYRRLDRVAGGCNSLPPAAIFPTRRLLYRCDNQLIPSTRPFENLQQLPEFHWAQPHECRRSWRDNWPTGGVRI
jgi:hypothetical protein